MYKVGSGSVCQMGKQSVFGTSVVPSVLLNMTSESIKATVTKGDEGNLLASKTANQRDVTSIKVDGGLSMILRPEFADLIFEVALGKKTAITGSSNYKYTLADPNTDIPVSTIVLSRGGIVKTYKDISVKSIKITANAQDYVKVDLDLLGVDEISAGETGAQTIQSISYTLPSYRCTQAVLKYAVGGTAQASLAQTLCVEGVEITIDNGLTEGPATYCTGLYSSRPAMGQRSVAVSFNIPYSDNIEQFYKDYYLDADSPTAAMELKFTTSNPDENVEIYMPYISFNGANRNVGGPDLIDTSFDGEALSMNSKEPIEVVVAHAEDEDDN